MTYGVVSGVERRLTHVEDWARRSADQQGLPAGGFIDHWIEGVVRPEEYTNLARLGVSVLVLFSYAGYVLRRQ
ncbi:DUF2784 family protein [Nonomuraea fuscirosea]|uniref:DUF2784 family protein n=1 Tax=Nonomuraea fuscirosea TaxID=1291556 RepID=UPI00342D1423